MVQASLVTGIRNTCKCDILCQRTWLKPCLLLPSRGRTGYKTFNSCASRRISNPSVPWAYDTLRPPMLDVNPPSIGLLDALIVGHHECSYVSNGMLVPPVPSSTVLTLLGGIRGACGTVNPQFPPPSLSWGRFGLSVFLGGCALLFQIRRAP